MTGRDLYDATAELAREYGLELLKPWEELTWREREDYEDMAAEVAAADNEESS